MARRRFPKLPPGLEWRVRNGRLVSPFIYTKKKIPGTGILLRESTKETDPARAEQYLIRRCNEVRDETVFGVRPKFTLRDACEKHLTERESKADTLPHEARLRTYRQIRDDAYHLDLLCRYLNDGAVPLANINMEHAGVKNLIRDRLAAGRKAKTVNATLEILRRILNKAAREWYCENSSLSWIPAAPKITLLDANDTRQSDVLSWDDQPHLLSLLPSHLQKMVLFKLNTGKREYVVCNLRWSWLERVDGVDRPIFVVPWEYHKTGGRRRKPAFVILNDTALRVVQSCRGDDPEFVFVCNERGHRGPVGKINNTGWKKAVAASGLQGRLTVHGLKNTYSSRLRAVGAPEWDIADLCDHYNKGMTHYYTQAALENRDADTINRLIQTANLVCQPRGELRKVRQA